LRATGERLRERNLRNLLDFIAEAEAAALLDQAALKTLFAATLGRLVDSDGVMLTGFDPRVQRNVTAATDPRVVELRAQEPELWASCLAHHPTATRFKATHGVGPLRFSEVLTPRAYRRLPIYDHFFRPVGVEYKLDVRAWTADPHHVDVGCWRERRDFDEQERAVLGALQPYLTISLRRGISLALSATVRDIFGLTAREAAVLALIVRGQRPPEIARELVIAPSTARRHIEHVYRRLGVSSRPQAIAQVLRHVATAFPGATDTIRELLARFDADAPLAPYDLTGRETEVLILAARGDTNQQIAQRLDIRPETVKKHLHHVYAKLGVAGRGRAAALTLALTAEDTPPAQCQDGPG
jgi:DNA-binding CsgD family transcriptional regulator